MTDRNDAKHSIIDYLEEGKDDSFNKVIYTILIHLALILGTSFGRDYFVDCLLPCYKVY